MRDELSRSHRYSTEDSSSSSETRRAPLGASSSEECPVARSYQPSRPEPFSATHGYRRRVPVSAVAPIVVPPVDVPHVTTKESAPIVIPASAPPVDVAELAAPQSVAPASTTGGSLEEPNDIMQCVVCWDRHFNMLFEPCLHVVCCEPCAMNVRICPFCQASIVSKRRIFIPSQ